MTNLKQLLRRGFLPAAEGDLPAKNDRLVSPLRQAETVVIMHLLQSCFLKSVRQDINYGCL
jgi:hypothetical protein